MAKRPSFQFYTGDWLKDPRLGICSTSTRGVWIDLLCAMHELDCSGQITGTPEQLARICRCTAVEFVQAIDELKTSNAADVTGGNGKVTVINRRMKAVYDERKAVNSRVLRHRQNAKRKCNGECNGNVTVLSSSSSSSSPSGGGERAPPDRGKTKTREKTRPEPRQLSILDLKDRKEALSEILSGLRVKHNFSYAEERKTNPEAYAEYKSVRAKITEINRQIAGLE